MQKSLGYIKERNLVWGILIGIILRLIMAGNSKAYIPDNSLLPVYFAEKIKFLQQNNSIDTVYTKVDQPAEFKGGVNKMYQFLGQNLRHPGMTSRNRIEGTVIGKFTVTQEGEIKDITIVQSLNKTADAELIRVVKLMPKWVPAQKGGKPVNSEFQLPISFR